jgi:hypothetical protein
MRASAEDLGAGSDTGVIRCSDVASRSSLADRGPAREPITRACARLRALAALSGSLTDALTPEAGAYLSTGQVTLTLRVTGIEPSENVSFDVTDTKTELSLSDQAHVFDRDWQHDPSATHAEGSSGLGKESTFLVSMPPTYVALTTPVHAVLSAELT